MKRKYIIILIIIVVIGIVAWYGYSEYNRPNKDLSEVKPEVTIDAQNLISAFEKDSSTASKLYIDKVLLVNGTIKSIDTSGIITLGPTGGMSSVQCVLDERTDVDYSMLKEGSNVSIQGKCTGYESDDLLGTDVKMNFSILKN